MRHETVTHTNAAKSGGSRSSKISFFESFTLSGTAAAISKTSAGPIERVRLLL